MGKYNGKYIVVESEVPDVAIRDIIECNEDMLFRTLSPHNREYFYIGLRSWDPVDEITVAINSREVSLKVHKSRAANYRPKEKEHFGFYRLKGTPIVVSSTFMHKDECPRDIGKALGHTLKNEGNIIWVLAGNEGGSSDYPRRFIEGLNDYEEDNVHVAWLKTHITDFNKVNLDNPYTEWVFSMADPIDYSKGSFSGNLYTIINSKTASAGENAVGYAKSIRNNILIGENTSGTGLFGQVQYFLLKHSFILLGIPCKILTSDSREGEGYSPDFWNHSSELIDIVTEWIYAKHL